MGVKVPGIKCSFWCESDIRGTNGTKREKYGEKYSGVNAPNEEIISIHIIIILTRERLFEALPMVGSVYNLTQI